MDGNDDRTTTLSNDFAATADWVRGEEIGRAVHIETPFGKRLICYADLTATGRHLQPVEDWIRGIRPFYANTHTEISTTGRMMTELRENARQVIARSVNAGADDEVVFVGSGATAAVNKLVGLLGLRVPEPLERRYGLSRAVPEDERPVVFVGPYEHHSNELPWLESIAEVVEIGLDERGAVCLSALRRQLDEHASSPLRIGSFSAASNVTGVISDVRAIARVLHGAGAFAFFDFAAAAPYMPIDMHPADPDERIDAIFLSPHKFVGGPESSGVLVAHRELFRTRTPERPGGGTVDYVAGPRSEDVDYVGRLAEREEGGTPAILGDVRAAIGFMIKDSAGPQTVFEHEVALAERATERLARHTRIEILGPPNLARLAIVPIEIEGLHHDFISALLDHLFGIQNRAGCSCAGPYGHRLLGIDHEKSAAFRALVRRGLNGMKPGWVRVSLPWYSSESDIEFILSAVEFVASHGMQFVPLYRLGWHDGVWRHLEKPDAGQAPFELSLAGLRAATDGNRPVIDEEALATERRGYFDVARAMADELRQRWAEAEPEWNAPTGDVDLDELVWFRYVHTDRGDRGL
ncbi:MAG: aminotransferase class V-fold PLP-dependent enzyme [bacterium]|nr:aminotransferase class V-fold PLP-dependent enzyme [bacterium]